MEAAKFRWIVRAATAFLVVLVASVAKPQLAAQLGTGGSPAKGRISPLIEALEQGKIAEDASRTPGGVWTFIDMEHAVVPTLEQVQERLAAMTFQRKPNGQLVSTPLVRVPMYGEESSRWLVKQILDSGGMGVIFPQVDTKEQALRAIRSMRYPNQKGAKYLNPEGNRGFGSSGLFPIWFVDGNPLGRDEYIKRADIWPLNPQGELFAVIMIESPLGVQNINSILEVPGIGAIFLGPSDLGMALGVGLPKDGAVSPLDSEEDAAIQTVLRACKAKNVIPGIAATWANKAYRQKLVDEGFRFFQ